jgi:hypothetical protein
MTAFSSFVNSAERGEINAVHHEIRDDIEENWRRNHSEVSAAREHDAGFEAGSGGNVQ